MAATEKDIRTCTKCGADIRPDTQFCYGCGTALTPTGNAVETAEPTADDASNESLADLERALAASRVAGVPKSRLDSAAEQRRRARIGNRKQSGVVWEPAGPSLIYFIAALAIFLIAAAIVFLTRAAK